MAQDRDDTTAATGDRTANPPIKRPYEPPRVLSDEAFEQLSLACMMKFGTKKNFT